MLHNHENEIDSIKATVNFITLCHLLEYHVRKLEEIGECETSVESLLNDICTTFVRVETLGYIFDSEITHMDTNCYSGSDGTMTYYRTYQYRGNIFGLSGNIIHFDGEVNDYGTYYMEYIAYNIMGMHDRKYRLQSAVYDYKTDITELMFVKEK